MRRPLIGATALLLVALGGAPGPTLQADERAPSIFGLEPSRLVPATEHARPVLLVAVAPHERNSRRFEEEALGDPEVRATLARDWLCARIEAPLPDEVAAPYGIGVLPAVVVLDRRGGFVKTIAGERSADDLRDELAAAHAAALEQEGDTRALLDARGGSVAERLERARLLLRRGLAPRATAALEELAALDPDGQEGAGAWAHARLATLAWRRGDLARGDAGLARVSSLAPGSATLVELRRERALALRAARRFAEAREELARLAPSLSTEERDHLTLDEAALLREEGRATDARRLLEALWDRASGPARALAEAALDADTEGGAPSEWRTLRDGRELVRRFGCAECHAIEPEVALPLQASCVQCHKAIVSGPRTREDRRDALALEPTRYSSERNVRHLLGAPDLSTTGVRMKRDWLRAFIRHPVDVRPFLRESMPRLPLSDGEVELVLDYLEVVGKRALRGAEPSAPAPDASRGSVARGEQVFLAKGCQKCHLYGNRRFEGGPAAEPWPRLAAESLRAAPNLRWVRDRARGETLAAWIREPRRFVKETPMPSFDLADGEMADLLAFLERGDPGEPAPLADPPRLPPPARAGTPHGAAREVFRDTCKHCHLPDAQGGVGNAGGGFGYAPIGLDLDTDAGPLRGSRGADGRRRSILAGPLLDRLLWRRDENRFDAWAPYRDPLIAVPSTRYEHPPGMPLGLPALDDEETAILRRFVADRAR